MLRPGISPRVFAACTLFVAILSGCHSSDGTGPKLTPVSGRVIFNNEAVTAASIYFIPDAEKGNRGEMASAILQTDGSFVMETYPKGAGVLPGAYKVKLDLGRRAEKELQPYRDVKTTPLSIDVSDQPIEGKVFELVEIKKDKGKENDKGKDKETPGK
jgi:hypothetical protein